MQPERDRARRRLQAARDGVARLDGAIHERKQDRSQELKGLYDAYVRLRNTASDEYDAWKAAVRRPREAPILRKPVYKAREAEALAAAGRATAFAAKNNGQLLMVDEARFEGGLGTSLAATGGSLVVRARFLGEARTVRIGCTLEDIVRGLHEKVWFALRRDAGF